MITHKESSTSAGRRPDGDVLTPFALGLTKHLAAANGAGANLVFSPISVYAALALVAAGARGRTLQELLAALGTRSRDELAGAVVWRALADQSGSGGPAVSFASAVWHDAACQVRQGFRDAAAASFNAETRAVDFRNEPEEAVCEINSWVAAVTNNLIDSILAPASLRPDTSLVLANAIYFKGKWKEPFNEARTTVDKFYRLDGSTADARFMRSGSSQFISIRDGLKVLKLPYESVAPPPRQNKRKRVTSTSKHGGGWLISTTAVHEVPWYSMYVFLPDARDGLPELVENITSTPAFWRDSLPKMELAVGEFRLPKFKLSFSSSLTDVLRDGMGVKAAFDASEADLSDLGKDEGSGMPLFASEVCHKAVIEVNEEGTVATASIHMGYNPTGLSPPKTVDFVADHPFVFFVVEEVSGAIMFVGHVLDPTKRSQ